eukprot:CAMPEP_0182512996 /NCGR_PEP_ID=MMETSP1321-20130603/33176_1 /TAXON_ID=91990 /ORGANISM="Bolidomonas sp., Strain RCC1657" /LENGTH=66 /DNA_ID=CAMNT_0024719931 /DNA_START=188 /DNA_END=385 /DNA_ORIENTATION=+
MGWNAYESKSTSSAYFSSDSRCDGIYYGLYPLISVLITSSIFRISAVRPSRFNGELQLEKYAKLDV